MDHNNLGYLRYFQNKVTPFSTKLSWLFSEVTNIAWKLCAKSLSYGTCRIIIACCFISFRRILIKNDIFSIILLIRWNSHYHFFFTHCFVIFTPYDCSGKNIENISTRSSWQLITEYFGSCVSNMCTI